MTESMSQGSAARPRTTDYESPTLENMHGVKGTTTQLETAFTPLAPVPFDLSAAVEDFTTIPEDAVEETSSVNDNAIARPESTILYFLHDAPDFFVSGRRGTRPLPGLLIIPSVLLIRTSSDAGVTRQKSRGDQTKRTTGTARTSRTGLKWTLPSPHLSR